MVKSINGDSKVGSLTLLNSKTKSETKLQSAKTDIVKDLVQLNNSKEIIKDKFCATTYAGIFGAGDVTDVPYK